MSAFLVGKEHINAMITAGLANHPHYGELSWYHEDEWNGLEEA